MPNSRRTIPGPGALCIAAIPATEDPKALFNKLMAWGLSMTVVGAIVYYLLFTP